MKKKTQILSEKYYRKNKRDYIIFTSVLILFSIILIYCGIRKDGFIPSVLIYLAGLLVAGIGLLVIFRKVNLDEHYRLYQMMKEKEIHNKENPSDQAPPDQKI